LRDKSDHSWDSQDKNNPRDPRRRYCQVATLNCSGVQFGVYRFIFLAINHQIQAPYYLRLPLSMIRATWNIIVLINEHLVRWL
jgi:hypothetical protein